MIAIELLGKYFVLLLSNRKIKDELEEDLLLKNDPLPKGY